MTLRKLPCNEELPKIMYAGTNLSSIVNIKDKAKREYRHNIIYETSCPHCDDKYIGKTG